MYEAPDRQACAGLRVTYCAQLRAHGQTDAAECLERDWDDFTIFYDFPQEHWIHLRTSNPIESLFAGVRLRTDAAKRMRVRTIPPSSQRMESPAFPGRFKQPLQRHQVPPAELIIVQWSGYWSAVR